MIANIEMQRQAVEKNAGLGASCSAAPRKLQERLEREKEALQLHGLDAGRQLTWRNAHRSPPRN